MTARIFVIEDHGSRPLTLNAVAGMHRQQWATHTRGVREHWAWLALEARVPRLDACEIEVTPLHKDGRSPQDVAACCAEAKGAVDGLVDAGVLVDDSPEFVRRVSFLPPDVCGVDGMRLTVREVTE